MRRNSLYTLVFLLVLLSSCNSLKDLAVIGIPMEFEQSFDVVVEDAVGLSFQQQDTIDFTENIDVQANLENINRYEIKELTYVIKNVVSDSEAPHLNNGAFTLTSLNNEALSISTALENIDLNEAEEATVEVGADLPFTAEDYTLLSEILGNDHQAHLTYSATMDTVVSFTIDVKLVVSLKIGI